MSLCVSRVAEVRVIVLKEPLLTRAGGDALCLPLSPVVLALAKGAVLALLCLFELCNINSSKEMGSSTFVFRLSLHLPSAELVTWVVSSRLLCFAAGEQNSLPLTPLQDQPFPPMTQQGERDAAHACPQRLSTGQGHRVPSKPSRDESDFLCDLFPRTGLLHARSTP